MLLGMLDGDLVLANAIVDGHGKVGDGSEGGDEGSQDVEQAFLLRKSQGRRVLPRVRQSRWGTYDWNTEGHYVEGNGGDEHNDEDNPDVHQLWLPRLGCRQGLPESAVANITSFLVDRCITWHYLL